MHSYVISTTFLFRQCTIVVVQKLLFEIFKKISLASNKLELSIIICYQEETFSFLKRSSKRIFLKIQN